MIAELISVGTELLLGEIVDSNAAWLAGQLKERGVTLHFKTVVGDNLERVIETLERALSRSDLVIVGGGLGPTDDDLTREAIASVVGETPTVDGVYLERLKGFFLSRGRSFPEQNVKQAWVLPSGEALPNPVGTAPGWFVRLQESGRWETARPDARSSRSPSTPHSSGAQPQPKIIVALPGPPREMKPMWTEQVLPRLKLPESGFYHRTFRTFGIGESHIAEKLGELTRQSNPSVATYARRDGVHVRVAALADTLERARELAALVEARVQAALEGFVYGTDAQTLPEVVGRLLAARGQTLSVLEGMTGGLIQDELTNEAGASNWFAGGAVAYSPQAKASFGVSLETGERDGWVSESAALEMAFQAKFFYDSDWGLSLSGVAGPGESEGLPAGTLWIGIAGPEGSVAVSSVSAGDRRTLKERAAMSALGLLWRALEGRVEW